MREKYMQQLRQLNNLLIQMGHLIEEAIEMAITALMKQDVELAKKAIAFDQNIDDMEKEIENLCLKILLCQQPVASDLRFVSAALKMVTDMERIGDHASDISEITILMADAPYIKKLEHIERMAVETTDMVIKSIEAYIENNAPKAYKVMEQDDIVDDLFMTTKEELIRLINENINNGEQATDLLMVAKYFERIGDHATNIAEWVIFSIEGKMVTAQ
ncbi:MAG: phosphate signaling complex protein PhoU [Lachnospiraceae bacterium]|nr:phosphate signaling complex protein PhoU [Lachnospiraceae bacterium]